MRKQLKKSKKFISFCAWCFESPKEQNETTEERTKKGYTVSHGICEKCVKNNF